MDSRFFLYTQANLFNIEINKLHGIRYEIEKVIYRWILLYDRIFYKKNQRIRTYSREREKQVLYAISTLNK